MHVHSVCSLIVTEPHTEHRILIKKKQLHNTHLRHTLVCVCE